MDIYEWCPNFDSHIHRFLYILLQPHGLYWTHTQMHRSSCISWKVYIIVHYFQWDTKWLKHMQICLFHTYLWRRPQPPHASLTVKPPSEKASAVPGKRRVIEGMPKLQGLWSEHRSCTFRSVRHSTAVSDPSLSTSCLRALLSAQHSKSGNQHIE